VRVFTPTSRGHDEISRLADVDNENDEYHVPVSPVDIWAEYARLRDEEGWTQKRIARAKGVSQTLVSMRLRLHTLSDRAKDFITQGVIDEKHLIEITQGITRVIDSFFPWLTTEQAWEELAAKAVQDKGKNGEKSVERRFRNTPRVYAKVVQRKENGLRCIGILVLTECPVPGTHSTVLARWVFDISSKWRLALLVGRL